VSVELGEGQPDDQIAEYYRLRYQLEFVIRDAKQHTGLTHCPKRGEDRLLSEHERRGGGIAPAFGQKEGMFAADRDAYNRMLISRLFSKLGLNAEFDRADPRIEEVVRIGHMAV